ncbi:regulating synaptic membrane exocytosis protein 2-like isoform X2 [Liolophura sinensis]|uniref:regulating synaptic membrane exocytosis protein 2-like isoform X2 n=1 Tax=Liolophura sinensis TaxID=3198878 RepID=UPI003158C94A
MLSNYRRLQHYIRSFEEQVEQQASTKSKRNHVDLRLCRLCYKNKFADGIGRVCQDCRRRVCGNCGSFTRPKWDYKKNKSVRGKWRCTMCQMKRELLCQTGIWFHGAGAKPAFNRKSFKAKVEASGLLETESDWGTLRDRRGSESNNSAVPGHRTDSELMKKAKSSGSDSKHSHKFHRRRSQLSISDSIHDKDDDDAYIDDAQFQRERQQDRKHRFQKKCRRRLPKSQHQRSVDNEHGLQVCSQYDSPYSSGNSVSGDNLSNDHRENHCEKTLKSRSPTNPRSPTHSRTPTKSRSPATSRSPGTPRSPVKSRSPAKSRSPIYSRSRSPNPTKSRESHSSKRSRTVPSKRRSSLSETSIENSVDLEQGNTDHSPIRPRDSSHTHFKIVRQGALSRSSSSTSIISDAKSSDVHSSAASPVFQRHETLTLQFRDSPKISIRTSSVPTPGGNEQDPQFPGSNEGSNQLLAPPTPTSHRRVTLSECENITINSSGEQNRFHPSSPHPVIIHRDKKDASYRTGGLGMRIVGGKSMADGSVGAYVTHVIKGGPADAQAGIRVGDTILEWNGRSLVNATFEEAREIMDKCEDIVQLLVLHTSNGEQSESQISPSVKAKIPKSDSADAQLIHKTSKNSLDPPKESSVISRPKRRMLPKTPIEIKKETKQISGRLLIQLCYTPATSRLTVATIRAEGLKPRSGSTKTLPRPLLLLYLLPGRNETGHYETQPGYETTNPEWNKTFIFAEITKDAIQEKALEVTVWDKNYSGDDEFLGEVLLDLKDANLDNEAVWFNLENHDENSSPLPLRKKSFSDISPLSSSSSIDLLGQRAQGVRTPSPNFSGRRSAELQRSLPLTPAHDKAKQLLTRGKTSPSRDCRSDRDYPVSRHSSPLPSPGSLTDPDNRGSVNLVQMDLLAPPRPLSRTPSETSFDEEDMETYSFSSRTPDRPAPEGDDVTSLLGPGQAPPKPAMEKVILGDIKLGFMVSKGQLEVDVICAKGLSRGPAVFPPGNGNTYVKTYLMEGNKKIQKKKTKLVKGSYEPIYRQKLKYSACNVYGRSMKINIWERQKTFDKKVSLGEAVVRLDNLDLSQHTMGWYKLFQISATDLGSSDSLANW